MSSMRKHGEWRLGGGLFLVQATDVYEYTTVSRLQNWEIVFFKMFPFLIFGISGQTGSP